MSNMISNYLVYLIRGNCRELKLEEFSYLERLLCKRLNIHKKKLYPMLHINNRNLNSDKQNKRLKYLFLVIEEVYRHDEAINLYNFILDSRIKIEDIEIDNISLLSFVLSSYYDGSFIVNYKMYILEAINEYTSYIGRI